MECILLIDGEFQGRLGLLRIWKMRISKRSNWSAREPMPLLWASNWRMAEMFLMICQGR